MNSKSFAQIMKMYGEWHMYDFFQLNFVGPSYKVIKRAKKKGVQFILGEHATIFKCVVEIQKEAKPVHNIGEHVPIILAKDESKVKSRISWDSN